MVGLWIGKLTATGHTVSDGGISTLDSVRSVRIIAGALSATQPLSIRREASGVMLLLLVSTEGKLAWWDSRAAQHSLIEALGDADACVRRDADLSVIQLWELPPVRRGLCRAILLRMFSSDGPSGCMIGFSEAGLPGEQHTWEDGADAADASLRAHRLTGESPRILLRATGMDCARDLVGLVACGLGPTAGEEIDGEGGGSSVAGSTGATEESGTDTMLISEDAKADKYVRKVAARALALLCSGHWGPGAVDEQTTSCAGREDAGKSAAADRASVQSSVAMRARLGSKAVAATLTPHRRLLGALAEAGRAGDGPLCADLAVALTACLRESKVLRSSVRQEM